MPEYREQISTAIRRCFEKEFWAFEGVSVLADALSDRNAGRVAIIQDRPSTEAVAGLYAKGRKTAKATLILAREGHGEDATILARSLTNLCINVSYICYEDSDLRAAQWMAAGWWARKRMAQNLGVVTLDVVEHDYNTEEGKALAEEWDRVTIERRAARAGQEHLYRIAYRHGSAFEHSDSWSVQGYADVHDDRVDLHIGPSTNEVGSALFIGAFALYQVVATVSAFYGFDLGVFDREAQRISTLDSGASDADRGHRRPHRGPRLHAARPLA